MPLHPQGFYNHCNRQLGSGDRYICLVGENDPSQPMLKGLRELQEIAESAGVQACPTIACWRNGEMIQVQGACMLFIQLKPWFWVDSCVAGGLSRLFPHWLSRAQISKTGEGGDPSFIRLMLETHAGMFPQLLSLVGQ